MQIPTVMHSLALLLVVALGASAQVDVDIDLGTIRGQEITLDDGKVVVSFKGVPFAKPPIGPLRFEPPEKAETWEGVFVADTLGNQCPQNPSGLLWMTHPGWDKYDEDCLNLNVFAPQNMNPETPYPVMVWFHGGGYGGGGNIQYPGHFLASHDVVVVVPNYRLSVFGFMATPDGYIQGNAGMRDQVLALEFIRDNAAAFGGDPNQVTSFGQSAGGSSTALHLLSPMSQGLVHQGICESGTDTNFWTLNWPQQSPEEYVYQTADRHDCTNATSEAMINCLREVPWEEFDRGIICHRGFYCMGYAPIVDGPGGFLPEDPETIRESGNFVQGNIITGICREDGSLYTDALIPEAGDGITREEFLRYLETRLLIIWRYQLTEQQIADAVAALDFYYSPWPHIHDEFANTDAFNFMITDAAFGMAMDRQAKWQQEVADTYVYIQGYRSPNATSLYAEWMGAPHNCEVPYVWGYPRLLHNTAVREDSEIVWDIIGWIDPVDIDFTNYFQTMWTNFARFGNPTPEPVPSPEGNDPTDWLKFSEGDYNYLETDWDIEVKQDYRQRDYIFWNEYLSYIVDKPIRFSEGIQDESMPARSSSFLEEKTSAMVWETLKKTLPGYLVEELLATKT